MTDDELMQATLLALTRQNVVERSEYGAMIGRCIIITTGFVADIPAIIGDYEDNS